MREENISQEFTLQNIDGTRNYFLKDIEQNKLMSRQHKNVQTTLNCIEHYLFLASPMNGCISISAFASLLRISVGITSSAVGLKMCARTAGAIKQKSIMKEKK